MWGRRASENRTAPECLIAAGPTTPSPVRVMGIDTVAAFVDALRQHRLLEPEQLEEVARAQARAVDPRALAKALINKGWLSPYQVNQIFQGQAASLVLG